MTRETGLWLHAVARGLSPERLSGLIGVGDAPVRAVEAGGLVAVVAPVDLAEYGTEALRHNLEDLSWLESVSWAHHRVADAVARLGPAVPTRLATVYRDEARVREVLSGQRAEFVALLDRVAGRNEWGVKAYAVADPPGTVAATAAPDHSAGMGAGSAYLNRRRAQLTASERSQQAAAEAAAEVHAELTRRAEAARRHAPQDRRLSGAEGWMVLNGAYLVEERDAEQFAALVHTLAGLHPRVRLELTGPWPPYSFVAAEDEEPAR